MIIDDHPLVRESMETALVDCFPSAHIRAYSSLENSLSCFHDSKESVDPNGFWWVLMDLGLKGITGLAAIRVLLSMEARIKLITVSGNDDELQVGACFGSGVSAFISKGASISESMNLVARLVNNEHPTSRWLSASGYRDVKEIRQIHLTDRQIQVLSMICEGKTNKDIAQALGITEITAKSHVGGIFKELRVINRTQAVLVAQKLGIVSTKY